MKKIVLKSINWYQNIISFDQGVFRARRRICAFYPTCSEYTVQAIEKYGVLKGVFIGIRRVGRCHPWQKNHHDPLI